MKFREPLAWVHWPGCLVPYDSFFVPGCRMEHSNIRLLHASNLPGFTETPKGGAFMKDLIKSSTAALGIPIKENHAVLLAETLQTLLASLERAASGYDLMAVEPYVPQVTPVVGHQGEGTR